MVSKLFLLTAFSCWLSSAVAANAGPAAGQQFTLYAYGGSLGGTPLIYNNGQAALGVLSSSNSSTQSNVTFEHESDSSSALVGSPANSTNPGWSDSYLYIPASSATSHQMGFTSAAASNESTAVFFFYGQTLMVKENGQMYSSFYAQPSSSDDGLYSLLWNVTEQDDTIVPIALRAAAPSN